MAVDPTTQELAQALHLHRAGRLEQAAKAYAGVRAKSPRNFDAWHLGGTVSLQLGHTSEALNFLAQAHQLKPSDLVCQMRLGLAELQAGQSRAAVARLERVAAAKPDFVDAWDNLGCARKQAGDLAGCVAAHRRAVAINPKYAQGWFNLGLAVAMAGNATEARTCHERALALDPNHRRAASARLFMLQYDDRVSREERFAAHRAFGDACHGRVPTPGAARAGRPPGPLRVGFVSSDFRQHSVPYFLEPLLAHLDPAACESFLYHDHPAEDSVSARLRTYSKAWRNLHALSDQAAEAIVRADAPDVLIDLTGHTGRHRLALFARRVAPVQATYLGYPDTTGLRTIDFRFTDAWADPVGAADPWHTERLVRFSSCAWAYQPPADAPDVAPLPCAASPGVTFGSFNHLAKVNATTLDLWSGVLNAVPSSRLILKSMGLEIPDVRARVRAQLERAGIAPTRVELLPATSGIAHHLQHYARIDIALDPFPYHGTTTTCEALWLGRPVVTLAGDRHVCRVGASLLQAVGHPEWIASSPMDYARIATELAADRPRLITASASLRARMQQSVLMDHAGQAQRFLSGLLGCVRGRPQAA